MASIIPNLPNPNMRAVTVYENELVTSDVLNRPLTRLLINDQFLYDLFITRAEELLTLAQGLGTTKNFSNPIHINYLPSSNQYVLGPTDFGRIIVMDGRQHQAGDKNPVVVLPSFSQLTDYDVGKTFTFTTRYGKSDDQASTCKVVSNLTDDIENVIPFFNNMNYQTQVTTGLPHGIYFENDISNVQNNVGTFCRIILMKFQEYSDALDVDNPPFRYFWLYEGNSNWQPKTKQLIESNDFTYSSFDLLNENKSIWSEAYAGSGIYYLNLGEQELISEEILPFIYRKPDYIEELDSKLVFNENKSGLGIGEWSWGTVPGSTDANSTIFVKLSVGQNPDTMSSDPSYIKGIIIEVI